MTFQTMNDVLDTSRPGRIVDLERLPGSANTRELAMYVGQVPIGFVMRYGPRTAPHYTAHGVLTHARADGPDRGAVVQAYLRELRKELSTRVGRARARGQV